ncbi:hypothetical protein [Campylobacter insulaenigrae]|uniref:hypothetical protein n=1 Tax=Campylobacter insulaenigrae TaxID=260714 RepID=UPI00215253C1|nr:hypothetical protein [Campylobacter insulaenigrae]MCR6574572.1 hypothetical protein [Campylobacter insulaenigrae]MCR6580712.1 hypothetical protein [Campylobacter insulaenigrae]
MFLFFSGLILVALFLVIFSLYLFTQKNGGITLNKIALFLGFFLIISISILIAVYLGILTTIKSVIISFVAIAFILILFIMGFAVNFAIFEAILSLKDKRQ